MSYERPAMPLPGTQNDKSETVIESLAERFKNKFSLHHKHHSANSNNNFPIADSKTQTVLHESPNNNLPIDLLNSKISSSDPCSFFPSVTHTLPIDGKISKDCQNGPIETNKFFGNLYLEDQTCTVWTNPYSLSFSKTDHLGLAVYHVTDDMKVFGPGDPAEYFLSPIGIKSLVFSAIEFENRVPQFELDFVSSPFSSHVRIFADKNFGSIQSTLVQGMGFVSCIYEGLTVQLGSIVGFKTFAKVDCMRPGIQKHRAILFNDKVWSIFVINLCEDSNIPTLNLSLKDNNHIIADRVCSSKVLVQVCCGEDIAYDNNAGAYVTDISLSASNNNGSATYRFSFGLEKSIYSPLSKPIQFAFPHHVESFSKQMNAWRTNIKLNSAVFGDMTAYVCDFFEMEENNLPSLIQFAPWSSLASFQTNNIEYSEDALSFIRKALESEINQNIKQFSILDSMYFSGKKLDKYAYMLYVSYYILHDIPKTERLLSGLKDAFNVFINNQQPNKLVYDTKFKGLISDAGLRGDPNLDFGNSFYNDHHFHYGYHVHAAALLVQVEKDMNGNSDFLNNERNKEYINFLIRDFCNSNSQDDCFPLYRSFDWFSGHSFAKGLFASADGKDQESSSEDYNAYYGVKLWAQVTQNSELEFIANLQLAILKRCCENYLLLKDDNRNLPSRFIKNKVPGILFENKCHHATYFGANLEYIQGIHMIPITPISSYYRDEEFTKQEWNELLKDHIQDVQGGWKGILMLNTALFDPKIAWNFFTKDNAIQYLDDGMSLTWSLAYIAGVGGSSL